MTGISRRSLLAGAAATAATAAFSSVGAALAADTPVPALSQQQLFLELSAKLTGIDALQLEPRVDPFGLTSEYFNRARGEDQGTFDSMLQVFSENQADPMVGDIVLNRSGSKIRFLARSVMLAWYLGAWYRPSILQQYSSAKPLLSSRRYSKETLVPCEIISPTAYTQGWVWRVIQAHPMGYGNLQFGYWSTEPPPLDKFIKST